MRSKSKGKDFGRPRGLVNQAILEASNDILRFAHALLVTDNEANYLQARDTNRTRWM